MLHLAHHCVAKLYRLDSGIRSVEERELSIGSEGPYWIGILRVIVTGRRLQAIVDMDRLTRTPHP